MATLKQFEDYLDRIITEINSFPDDKSLWVVPVGVLNSPGNLGLHITGNLLHFIGAIMGKTGYIRDREREFNIKDLPRSEVIRQLELAKHTLQQVLGNRTEATGLNEYPELFKGKKVSENEALSHLLAHLAYHTGQINYLRRIIHPQ